MEKVWRVFGKTFGSIATIPIFISTTVVSAAFAVADGDNLFDAIHTGLLEGAELANDMTEDAGEWAVDHTELLNDLAKPLVRLMISKI